MQGEDGGENGGEGDEHDAAGLITELIKSVEVAYDGGGREEKVSYVRALVSNDHQTIAYASVTCTKIKPRGQQNQEVGRPLGQTSINQIIYS